MKKIFTLIAAALLGVAATNATVTVTCNGKTIANGETYTFYANDFKVTPTPIPNMSIFNASALFTLTSDKGSMTVNYTAETTGLKARLQFCQEGAQCLVDGKDTPISVNPANFDGEVSYTMVPELPKEQGRMRIKASDASGVVTEFYIAFDSSKENAVSSVVADEASLSINGKVLTYKVASATAVNIYDAAGALVLSAEANGEGSLNLSALGTGIYICHASGQTLKFAL